MTTETTPESAETPEANRAPEANQTPEEMSWPDRAAHLANIIAHYPVYNRGDLAQLRRMNHDRPTAPAFLRIANRYRFGQDEEDLHRWALVLRGIAIMTPNSNTHDHIRSAHNPYVSVGRALFQGSNPNRTQAICSESRVRKLTNSTGSAFRNNLLSTLRMLARDQTSLDWRELANLILDVGRNRNATEKHREYIARQYYQAEYRASRNQ